MIDYIHIIDGELLFGYIHRFHLYSGNTTYSRTANELWGNSRKWLYSPLFPLHIKEIIEELNISLNEYIEHYSILPFFRPFTSIEKYNSVINRYLLENRSCYNQFFKTGSVHEKDTMVKYCPACIRENYYLPYFRREHQIQGVYVCTKHNCILEEYHWDRRKRITKIDESTFCRVEIKNENKILLDIAKDVEYLLNSNLDINIRKIQQLLKEKAIAESFFTSNNCWILDEKRRFQKRYINIPPLYKETIEMFSIRQLVEQSDICRIKPLKYLLAIDSLYGSFEEMVKYISLTHSCGT